MNPDIFDYITRMKPLLGIGVNKMFHNRVNKDVYRVRNKIWKYNTTKRSTFVEGVYLAQKTKLTRINKIITNVIYEFDDEKCKFLFKIIKWRKYDSFIIKQEDYDIKLKDVSYLKEDWFYSIIVPAFK